METREMAVQTDIEGIDRVLENYTTRRYHTDAEFRQKQLKMIAKCNAERKKTDEEFREKCKASNKKSIAKFYEDPVNAEKKRQYNRERYQRLKAEKEAQLLLAATSLQAAVQ